MPHWPGNKPEQRTVADIIKEYGPISNDDIAKEVQADRERLAGNPPSGSEPSRGLRQQVKSVVRTLIGAEKVQDVNRGAEGTKPQWIPRTPVPEEKAKHRRPGFVSKEREERRLQLQREREEERLRNLRETDDYRQKNPVIKRGTRRTADPATWRSDPKPSQPKDKPQGRTADPMTWNQPQQDQGGKGGGRTADPMTWNQPQDQGNTGGRTADPMTWGKGNDPPDDNGGKNASGGDGKIPW